MSLKLFENCEEKYLKQTKNVNLKIYNFSPCVLWMKYLICVCLKKQLFLEHFFHCWNINRKNTSLSNSLLCVLLRKKRKNSSLLCWNSVTRCFYECDMLLVYCCKSRTCSRTMRLDVHMLPSTCVKREWWLHQLEVMSSNRLKTFALLAYTQRRT